MPWGALATVAVGAYSANQQNNAAQGQQQASQDAIAEQRRQYDLMRGDLSPYMQQGQYATVALQRLFDGDNSGWMKSADYTGARDAMTYAGDHSAAARGRLFSGGYMADLSRAQGDLASQYMGNYRSGLMGLAQLGQASAAGVGAAGMSSANQTGNYLQAGASSYGQIANNNSQLASGIGSAFGDWYNRNSYNNGGGSGFYFGNNPGRG